MACTAIHPGAPLTYFNDEGGARVIFLRFEIFAKSDFLGSMKDAGILLDHEKKQRNILGFRKKD